MISYLSKKDKQLTKTLYKESFPEDSDSFVDYYYKVKTDDNRILADITDGVVTSMVQLNPYKIVVKDKLYNLDYIVAVATDAKYRRQGYMRKLLMKMLDDMYEANTPWTYLMPANRAYYEPFGFRFIYGKAKPIIAKEKSLLGFTDEDGMKKLADEINAKLKKQYEVYAFRDITYMKRFLEEYRLELLDGDSGDHIPDPTIMARITNLAEFVKTICLKEDSSCEMDIKIWVEDKQITKQSGAWIWHIDNEGSSMERASFSRTENDVYELSIENMTSWLFGYEPCPYDYKWCAGVRVLHGVYLDEYV